MPRRNDSGSDAENRRRVSKRLDELDIKIITALLADAEIPTSELARKLNKPLPTVQRRRAKIHKFILRRKYTIDPGLGNFRVAQLMILASKGNAKAAAFQIFEKYPQLSRVVTGINSTANIMATLYFKETETLHETMQEISKMPFIEKVQFFEPVMLVGEREMTLAWLMKKQNGLLRQ